MIKSGHGESELMRRVARRDGEALAELYDLYAARVFGVCLRILNESQLAEDMLQEVFMRVWERGHLYDASRGSLGTWMMGITRNLCIDQLRRQRARPQAAEQPGDDAPPLEDTLPDLDTDVPAAVARNEQAALVRQALTALTPEQRLVIELSYFRGFTRREIARKLKWPEGTVHTRARLALQNLRQQLDRLGLKAEEL